MSNLRLGDIEDDFCVKCKRVTNHAIVSIVNDEPAKVRCRTCYHEHDFRHGEAPPKKDPRKESLFKEVLSTIDPAAAAAQTPEKQTDEKKPKSRKKSAPESPSA
ncbi:MAG TPA: hypothetical protein VHA11_08625 [Bryobacteraceae bacterium]|nr:hypothetical protein [Bryobacteraceae bacterium]